MNEHPDSPQAASGMTRREAMKATAVTLGAFTFPVPLSLAADPAKPFGEGFPKLDSLATGEWWLAKPPLNNAPPRMEVPRDQVVAFALYTQERGVLKMTAQLYPLKPGESREVRLELQREGTWNEMARVPVTMPGWSAHFRVEKWDASQDVPYRVRHGAEAIFEGLIRRDPVDKEVIVMASMSCNSSRTTGQRPEMIDNLRMQDPDLLFFAGDQTYRHTEHTAGWIEFGLQFRDIIRDRPTICIPDDHDVGHPNLWGENGKLSVRKDNADGGYFYPVEYVNMVQRQQSWSLPDPVDPAPVERGITVYFTRLRLGGIDFAILEDRKFKSGPAGGIEGRAFADCLLRCRAHARRAGRPSPRGPRLQRLAADATPPRPRGNPPRPRRASLRRPASGGGGEAGHRCLRGRPLAIHQPRFGEHDLWPMVASA
jgi:hypothetical protein